ncbi:MAG: filamentous hemagglutinin N-terminal domain-containing protein, partial [Acidobacteriaceae bacterium]|nr:filamentous hemagglutinin N-terminal domain-containing protein [Acidobacteriaceae bacterium]
MDHGRTFGAADSRQPAESRFSLRKFLVAVLVGCVFGQLLSFAGQPVTLPSGGNFTAGAGAISASGNTLTINQATARGIIDWNSFSIGAGGLVQFRNGSGVTLNRVNGGAMSSILGSLIASGSIYLLNPQGVLIGPKGTVKTGGDFIASTLHLSNDAFLGGSSLLFVGDSTALVKNLGSISSKNGSVFLIARSIENSGSIKAANVTVGLGAGTQVLLKDSSSDQRVFVQAAGGDITNTGSIAAAEAEVRAAGGNIYALAGNNGGQIRATGTATKNGHVWLIAEGGTLDVTGTVHAQNANGTGGAVETSGGNVSFDGGHIGTGKGGSWLVDPYDLTVNSTAATTIKNSLASGTDVTLTTSATGASGPGTQNSSGSGDIIINSGISWSTGNTLTLSAYRNVKISSGYTVKNTGSGNLNLIADNTGNGTGTVTINGTVDYSGSTGVVSAYYDPTGTTKYTNPLTYGTHLKTNAGI